MSSSSVEWWIDEPALPDLRWARLTIYDKGNADVLIDRLYEFGSKEDAMYWLVEEEYREFDYLNEDGVLPAGTMPPSAPN